MSSYVVWIDHQHAKAFALKDDGSFEKSSVQAHHRDHHTHSFNHIDQLRESRAMFNEAAGLIRDAQRVLIVGPGLAKHLFNNHLAEHFPRLFRKVAGCEAVDHPTDPQIRAIARRFFGPISE